MALDFPSSPTNGQKYPASPIVGVPTYTWDGEKWTTAGSGLVGQYVARAGDTMTGNLGVKPPTGNSVLIMDNSEALRQSVVNFNQTGAVKWQFGKQTDDSFMLYDAIKTDTVFRALSNGPDVTYQRPIVLPGDPTTALQAATKQYVDAKAGQRFALAGLTTIDIAVPATAVGVNIDGIFFSGSAVAGGSLLMGPSAGVFPNGASDYGVGGFYNYAGGTTIGVVNNNLVSSFQLHGQNDATSIPAFTTGTIALVRPNTASTNFGGRIEGTCFTSANGILQIFYHQYLTIAPSGSSLRLVALRVMTSTGATWGPQSYLNMAWF